MSSPLQPPARTTYVLRCLAIGMALVMAVLAGMLMLEVALQDGSDALDYLRFALIVITTAWLAWGAMLAFLGLKQGPKATSAPTTTQPQPATVILMPICNEDAVATFARLAAIDRSVRAAGVRADIAVLSDTGDETLARTERAAFERMVADLPGGEGARAIYYRRRTDNHGRKAGNIEDFIRRSGGAYEFAIILDADSLMEGGAIRDLIARMQQDPKLGLLQTLPRVIAAQSFFGRAMQFAAAFHGPVFTRGLARLQGNTGPFWGHNAIVRVPAFAQSCGLPVLSGPPPFGGCVLSHDYAEAALLARAGWSVRVDPTIGGSYEEAPENVFSYARRDRRWCQGNLQHLRLLFAPGLRGWSRFVFAQNAMSYLVALLWAGFLLASFAATLLAPPPDYFPEPHLLFPVLPSDRTKELTALMLGIVGLLILPKFAILIEAGIAKRRAGFGSTRRALASVSTEILLSSVMAPVLLMFQLRAVVQVLSGQDGGWPANARGDGQITFVQALRPSLWISIIGAVALFGAFMLSPALAPWLLPVCVPMIAAPWLISFTSRRLTFAVFRTPDETTPPEVLTDYRAIAARWQAQTVATPQKTSASEPNFVAA